MDQKCKSCGKIIDAALVICPSCKNPPTEEPKLELKPEQIKQVGKQVKKEIRKTVLFWLGIISLASGFGVWQAYIAGVEKMQSLLVQRISGEFEEPTIKKTVQDVARTQAKKLLDDEIAPEWEKISGQVSDFRTYLDETERQFKDEYLQLSKEVEFLRKRNMLLRLADEAITTGAVNALNIWLVILVLKQRLLCVKWHCQKF